MVEPGEFDWPPDVSEPGEFTSVEEAVLSLLSTLGGVVLGSSEESIVVGVADNISTASVADVCAGLEVLASRASPVFGIFGMIGSAGGNMLSKMDIAVSVAAAVVFSGAELDCIDTSSLCELSEEDAALSVLPDDS